MRKVAEGREGIERGFHVFYREEYIFECPNDYAKRIKCLGCGRLTEIIKTRRSPLKTAFGDVVAADVEELWCDCGRHLGTMENSGEYNKYGRPLIALDKNILLEEE